VWYTEDVSGNIDSCEITVIVEDVDPPQFLTCPADTLEDIVDPAECDITNFNLEDPTWDVGCGADLRYELSGATTGSGNGLIDPSTVTLNVGVTTITYILEDLSGNADTCIFWAWAKHVDFPSATVECPTPDTVRAVADAASCDIYVALDAPVITDPCNEIDTVWNNSPYRTSYADASGTYPIGTHDFVWYIEDVSGNIDSCEITVIVEDVNPPQFLTCPADTLEDIVDPAECDITNFNLVDPTWDVGCGADLRYELSGATTGSGNGLIDPSVTTFNVGVTTITYILEDPSGNADTCIYWAWAKREDFPSAAITCPPATVEVTVAEDSCETFIQLDTVEFTDPCNEIDSIWNDSPYRLSEADASGRYPIGTTTFNWYILDVSGNVQTCDVTVIVNDRMPILTCPPDTVVPADFNEAFASGIEVGLPTYQDNCDSILTYTILDPSGNLDSIYTDPSDINLLTGPQTYDIGVTTITYYLEDGHGNKVSCSFTVTVTGAPVIECPPDTTVYLDGTEGICAATFDPGTATLIEGVPPIEWTYTITFPDGSILTDTYTKDAPDQYANPLGDIDFPLDTTVITWSAKNISGADTCDHLVIVRDTIPPTFVIPAYTNCVDPLHWAVYDPANANPVVNHIDPLVNKFPVDYRTLPAGDTSLDLTSLEDNCCDSVDMIINWQIDFSDTPDPQNAGGWISHGSITGTGLPSEYDEDNDGVTDPILLWGDGVQFNDVTHTITYWVEDCNGNISDEYTGLIVITPRPQITKEDY
jgi:hypothetical protein